MKPRHLCSVAKFSVEYTSQNSGSICIYLFNFRLDISQVYYQKPFLLIYETQKYEMDGIQMESVCVQYGCLMEVTSIQQLLYIMQCRKSVTMSNIFFQSCGKHWEYRSTVVYILEISPMVPFLTWVKVGSLRLGVRVLISKTWLKNKFQKNLKLPVHYRQSTSGNY